MTHAERRFNMKDNFTEILFALDCAAASNNQKENAVKAFKSFISAKKKSDCEINVSAVAYAGKYMDAFTNVPVAKIKPAQYVFPEDASGACAMLDAAQHLMDSAGQRYSDTPEEERPSKVIMVITVFGRDNASKTCTYEKLKEMIAHQRDIYKWKFYLITDFSINMEKLGIAEDDTILIKKSEKDWFKEPFVSLGDMIDKYIAK